MGSQLIQIGLIMIYRQGFTQDHSLNISGANENTSYYFSGGYTKQEGIVKSNDFVRKNILMNIENRFNKRLTIGGKISYSNELNLANSIQRFQEKHLVLPVWAVHNLLLHQTYLLTRMTVLIIYQLQVILLVV